MPQMFHLSWVYQDEVWTETNPKNVKEKFVIYSLLREAQELAWIQSKAIGLRKASGIPKELTTESAWGLRSPHSFMTSFLAAAALSSDKYP